MPGRPLDPSTNSMSHSFSGHIEYQNTLAVSTTESLFPSYAHGIVPPRHQSTYTAIPLAQQESPSPIPSTSSATTANPSFSKCKRGRPRLLRNAPPLSNTSPENMPSLPLTTKPTPSQGICVPHNQVEQKYRNGLNDDINRLHDVVASTQQNSEDGVKLSKAMVFTRECSQQILLLN